MYVCVCVYVCMYVCMYVCAYCAEIMMTAFFVKYQSQIIAEGSGFLMNFNLSCTCIHIVCIHIMQTTLVMLMCVTGKKLLSRSQTRAVAEKRKEKINDYCRVCYWHV